MGGRGSSSGVGGLPTLTPGGGGGNMPFGNPSGVGVPSPSTLKGALGTRGRPNSVVNAVENSNPFYDGTAAEFSENCQRAVIAYEARRRGYDVVAQPTYQGDTLPQAAYTNPRTGARNSRWMGAFQRARPVSVGARNARDAQRRLEDQMRQFGNGARAIVSVHWNNGGGHVFNVENRNGNIIYVDAQVGGRYNPRELFRAIRTSETNITRTDNLRFSERARRSVEPATRRTGSRPEPIRNGRRQGG